MIYLIFFKLIILFFIHHTTCFSFHDTKNIETECTDENYKKFGLDPEEVINCQDVKVKLEELENDKFWLIIDQFYNVHYYDMEFNDNSSVNSILSPGFQINQLFRRSKRRFYIYTDYEIHDILDNLHSLRDFDTKTSLLLSKKNLSLNGILFNKYHIRSVNNDNNKHIVIELRDTTDIYEDFYYDNFPRQAIINSNKNEVDVNLNINVGYSKEHAKIETEMLAMNIMIYWNAVSMLFSGINNTLVHIPNINIKIKSINIAKASGIIFPHDLNTLFSIYRSLKHYFVDNSMSIRSNVDVEIAMTASKICLRGVDNNCDLQGYTLLLTDDNRNHKYNIAIMNYNMLLLDYAIGARELAHSLGVKYIEADKECSGIMSRRYRFSDEQLRWCNDSLNDFGSAKKFVSSIRGNNVSNKNSRNPLISSDDEGEELVVPFDLSYKF